MWCQAERGDGQGTSGRDADRFLSTDWSDGCAGSNIFGGVCKRRKKLHQFWETKEQGMTPEEVIYYDYRIVTLSVLVAVLGALLYD